MAKVCNTLYGVAVTNIDFTEVVVKIAFNPSNVREIINSYEASCKVFVFKLKKDWKVVDYFNCYAGLICRYGLETVENITPALKTLWQNVTEDEMCSFFGE